MIPVVDFLRQPILDRCHRPYHEVFAPRANLLNMLRNEGFDRITDNNRFEVALSAKFATPELARSQRVPRASWPVVQVGRIASVLRRTGRINLNELKLPGNNAVIPSLVNSSVLDGVLQIEERSNVLSRIIRVYQHGAALQQVAIPFQDQDRWLRRAEGAQEIRKSPAAVPVPRAATSRR